MRLLITGGAGFIGSAITRECVKRCDNILVVDNFSSGKLENLPKTPRVQVERMDIRDVEGLSSLLKEYHADGIFHLAATVSVEEVENNEDDAFDNNVKGTFSILHAARQAGIRRIVFASSAAVYGAASLYCDSQIKEDSAKQPISAYGYHKYLGEIIGEMFATIYDMNICALRFFNVYGPRQDPSSPYSGVISKFCRAAIEGTQPVIYGDGQQVRDFIYVDDVAKACYLAMQRISLFSDKYLALNVGTGRAISILDLWCEIKKITGSMAGFDFGPKRKGDIRYSVADITAAQRYLGLTPQTTLRIGLQNTLNWIRYGS
ncbi:NAD-dependent epimerase/dehydratase family protein [Candidatus Parcubacteria bacterium]|nr:MAG: NAD-dependent epimerase/dehydratase family protein [Candidatus Parcubacteria bacterium]